jgi:hypothetical protein
MFKKLIALLLAPLNKKKTTADKKNKAKKKNKKSNGSIYPLR